MRFKSAKELRKTHGSEVNIYRVMTRNETAVFKKESTLPVNTFFFFPIYFGFLGFLGF